MRPVQDNDANEETTVYETPGVCGGYPCIGNTRIPVRVIIEAFRTYGNVEGAADYFPQLSRAQVDAALAYYAAHPARVDGDIERNDRVHRDHLARTRQERSSGMRDWLTVPEGETDEVHLTPDAFLAYRLQRLGKMAEQNVVHPTVLLAFQTHIAEQFVQETHARPVGDGFSTQTSAPMWNGTLGGAPVSIQQLPVGAPMAITTFELLIEAGARIFILAGIAGSLTPRVPIGGIVIPTGALREEGTSYHYLPPDVEPEPDAELTAALIMAAEARGITPGIGRVWTTDAIFREMGWKVRHYSAAGILAVEMELSALLAVAQVHGVRLAAVFAISDELFHPWTPGWHVEHFLTGSRAAANIALDVAAAVNTAHAGK